MFAVIYDAATGVIQQTISGSQETIDADGRPHLAVDEWRDDYDARYRVIDGALVARPVSMATLAQVEIDLIAQIDAQRRMLQAALLTAGGSLDFVHGRKAGEVIDARSTSATVLNALGLADKQKRFPFAQAEAAITGETLSAVLARFDAGMNASLPRIAAIDAIAVTTKRKVRAAGSVAAKQAAANVSWG